MNLRLFSATLLISALPLAASARSALELRPADFTAAKKVSRNGESIVRVKLSKSGKAKIKRLNQNAVGQEVHSEIGGVVTNFTLREPIKGNGLEIGPYSEEDAERVVADINRE